MHGARTQSQIAYVPLSLRLHPFLHILLPEGDFILLTHSVKSIMRGAERGALRLSQAPSGSFGPNCSRSSWSAQPQRISKNVPIFGNTHKNKVENSAHANPHHVTRRVPPSRRESTHKKTHTQPLAQTLAHTQTQMHTLSDCLMPSQLPARLPSYYLSAGSHGKMQMFVSLGIESVTAKLRAICKNRGTNSLKCLYGRERRVRARGLTDCSIRKPITAG